MVVTGRLTQSLDIFIGMVRLIKKGYTGAFKQRQRFTPYSKTVFASPYPFIVKYSIRIGKNLFF